jgi:excisionase family DNA binding protein
MAKLINLEEAAKILGLSVDKLTEMREKSEIFGYRDGSTWKFKESEVQRVASDMGISMQDAGDADLDFEMSDSAIGLEASSGSSSDSIEMGSDSMDLILEDDSDDQAALQDSDIVLEGEQESELKFGESDLRLAAEGSGNLLDDDQPKEGGASDTGKLDDELSLAEDELFEDELELSDSASFEDSLELDSDLEDSDLVLDDSDSGSDVVLGADDSGINLSPNDSGISLEEEPLELGGSDIDSLELPEDDELITLEEAADPDMATQLAADDDFNLTPLEDMVDDESSGSQIIALEDSEIYADESSATVLADSDIVEQPALLPEDHVDASFQPGLVTDAAMVPAIPEAPYSIFQILSLALVAFLCVMGLVIAFDICRFIWQPEQTMLSSTVLDFFSGALGMKDSK